ncbi:uncharacterized protein [Nicotiana sylvestris]|uniref:uncharacterized protein n=1 Tax=Nicotiana sylvestris TaxID=4096 RepID=UPI00388C3580
MDQDISWWHIWDDLARDFVRQFQYNIDIALDRNSLSNLKKKSSESFQEHAVKWREQTARVNPPMDETNMVSVFLQAQEADYFQNMMPAMGKPFADAIKIGEMIENGLKTGRVLSQSTIRATSQAIQGRSRGVANRKKKEEVAMATLIIVLKDEDVPNVTNNPLSAHNNEPVIAMICEDKEFDPALKAIIAIADVEKKPKAATKQDKGEKKSKPTPQNTEKNVETETGAAPSKDVILYVPWGHRKGQVTLSPPRRFELNKGSKMYVPKGTYVRPMTDPTTVPWNYNKAVVTYKGKEVLGETNKTNPIEKYLNLEEVNNAMKKRFPLKKPVSLLSLLMNSTEHQKVLIKTLNEAYVPIETTMEQLERTAERFFAVNQICFSKNDLPLEWATHNKALHLKVKCEGYYVKKVMLDGGFGVDICPLSTLQRMEIATERIRPNNVCVRAFDGIKRDTIGEIDLILTICLVDFKVTFQVLDMDNSYNFLLRRPWIHAEGIVPSTLH